MIIISSMAHHASFWMNLPLALLIVLFWGVVLGSSSAPAAIDWRNNNGRSYVTSVKYHGVLGCEISWAYAAVSVVESALLIKGGGPEGGYDLSEPQVLDCGGYPRDWYHCLNGTVDDAFRFITTRGSLSQEQDYLPPFYTGVCHQPTPWGSIVSIRGLKSYPMVGNDEDQLPQVLATHGPIAVTICPHRDFNLYRGGIYNNPSCRKDCDQRISMALVGYETQDGIPYWILKNSWGTHFGEWGYLKLARGYNRCGIATHPSYFLA